MSALFIICFSSFFLAAFSVCPDGVVDGSEDCDGGAHCSASCACDVGFEATLPSPSLFCVEECYNPVLPLESEQPESTITVDLTNSLVDFHAFMIHQSTDVTSLSGAGSLVVGTTVLFGSLGTVCDFPANTMLQAQTLDTGSCLDDIGNDDIDFADFSPCLVQSCTDAGTPALPVDCSDPDTCTNAPCIVQWASPVTFTRTYTVFNANGDSFPRTTSSGHNVLFTFPWVQSTAVSVIVWETPDTPASAAITSIIFNGVTNVWTVVVSLSMDWPYQIFEPTGIAQINGHVYTVSACATTPNSTVPCVQTITFTVTGCTGIHTEFAGISQTYTNLLYQCANMASPDCPLAAGTSRPAVLSIKIDTEADCGPAESSTTITPSDVTFALKQSNFIADRGSFIDGDTIAFLFSVDKVLTTAAVSSIDIVSFEEATFGTPDLTYTRDSTGAVCSAPENLCFTLNTATEVLQNIPAGASATLSFSVTVEIQFEGISKKRMVLATSNLPISASTQASMEASMASAPMVLVPLLAFITRLFLF